MPTPTSVKKQSTRPSSKKNGQATTSSPVTSNIFIYIGIAFALLLGVLFFIMQQLTVYP